MTDRFFAFFFWTPLVKKWWMLKGEEALTSAPIRGPGEGMKVAGPGVKGPVAGNYLSTCPEYLGYYLPVGCTGESMTECRRGGMMTGAAWYQYCGRNPEACPLRKEAAE